MKLRYKGICYYIEDVKYTDTIGTVLDNFDIFRKDLQKLKELKISTIIHVYDGLESIAMNEIPSKNPDKIFELRIELR